MKTAPVQGRGEPTSSPGQVVQPHAGAYDFYLPGQRRARPAPTAAHLGRPRDRLAWLPRPMVTSTSRTNRGAQCEAVRPVRGLEHQSGNRCASNAAQDDKRRPSLIRGQAPLRFHGLRCPPTRGADDRDQERRRRQDRPASRHSPSRPQPIVRSPDFAEASTASRGSAYRVNGKSFLGIMRP